MKKVTYQIVIKELKIWQAKMLEDEWWVCYRQRIQNEFCLSKNVNEQIKYYLVFVYRKQINTMRVIIATRI